MTLHLHLLIHQNRYGDYWPVWIYAESPEIAQAEKDIILSEHNGTEFLFAPQPEGSTAFLPFGKEHFYPPTMEYDPTIGREIAYLWRSVKEPRRITYRKECIVY